MLSWRELQHRCIAQGGDSSSATSSRLTQYAVAVSISTSSSVFRRGHPPDLQSISKIAATGAAQ